MRNRKSWPMAAACVAMGVSTFTWTQASADEDKPQQTERQTQQTERRIDRDQVRMKLQLQRVKEILNKEVRNRQDEKLGKLEELAVDVDRGIAAYAILDVGGFLGIGGKRVVVPLEVLRIEREPAARDVRIVADLDKDKLKNAPGFDKDAWPDMANAQWAKETHSYFGVRPYWEMERERAARGETERDLKGEPISPRPGEQATPEAQRKAQKRARADMPGKKILKAEGDLLHRDIKSQSGEDLGDVRDLIVDSRTGEIAFIVAEFDDAKVSEDKEKRMALIPYQLVELRPDQPGEKGAFFLTTNLDRVRGQLFSKNTWPNLNEREAVIAIYKHYDVQPYWEMRRMGREQHGTQQQPGERTQEQQPQSK